MNVVEHFILLKIKTYSILYYFHYYVYDPKFLFYGLVSKSIIDKKKKYMYNIYYVCFGTHLRKTRMTQFYIL